MGSTRPLSGLIFMKSCLGGKRKMCLVLASEGCHKKVPQTVSLKSTQICWLIVLKSESLKLKFWQGHAPPTSQGPGLGTGWGRWRGQKREEKEAEKGKGKKSGASE